MYKIQAKIGGYWKDLNTANLENISIVKAIESGHIFARSQVNGSIQFFGQDFYDLELELTNFSQIQANIYRTEPSATNVVSGYLNLFGLWDYDRKFCELSFNVVDSYTKLFERWDEPDNRTTYSTTVSINLQSETVNLSIPANSIPGTNGEHNWKYVGGTPGYKHYVKQLIKIPVNGWDCDEGLPDFGSTINPDTGEYLFPVYPNYYSKQVSTTQTVIKAVSNFVDLFTSVEQRLENVEIEISEATYCNYFTLHGLTKLMIAQKSKVIDNEAVASSKWPTLKQFLELYKIMFNVDWVIENDYFYLKHPSERVQILPSFVTWPKHDLTSINSQSWTVQSHKWTFKANEMPYKEVWQTERTYEFDFDGYPIRYSEAITKNHIEYELSQYQTNIAAVLIAGDESSIRKEDISDDGFVVVACDSNRNVISQAGIFDTSELINGKLALSNLHNEHHKTGDRYFSTGEMNLETTSFTNIRTKRELLSQVPGFITDFSFDHLVKTGFGNMKLVSVTEYCNGKLTELKLEY